MTHENDALGYVGRIHRSVDSQAYINCNVLNNLHFHYLSEGEPQQRSMTEISFTMPEINIAQELGARLRFGPWANTTEYYVQPNITFLPNPRWFDILEYIPTAPPISRTTTAFFMNPKLNARLGANTPNWTPEDTLMYQLTNQVYVMILSGDLLGNDRDHPVFLSPIDQMGEKTQLGIGSAQCFNEASGDYLAITLATVGNPNRDGTGMANHIPISVANYIPVSDITKNLKFTRAAPQTQRNLFCGEFLTELTAGWSGYVVNSKQVPLAWISKTMPTVELSDGSINGLLDIPSGTNIGKWFIDLDVYARKEHPFVA